MTETLWQVRVEFPQAVAEVTVETLTDEMIQSIIDEGLDPNCPDDRELAAIIKSARNPLCHPPRRAEARQRICNAINARLRRSTP